MTKKDLCYFKPQKSIRQVWNDATAACSKLTKKTNQERLNVSTKLWENKDNVKTVKTNAISKKRRRESCESPLPTEQPKTKRPKLVLKAEKLIDSIPLKVLEENKRKLKTGFKLFQLANKEACIKKHGKSAYKFTYIQICNMENFVILLFLQCYPKWKHSVEVGCLLNSVSILIFAPDAN